MAIEFVTKQEDLKIPKGGLILTERKPEDYIFGASPVKQKILRPDGQHDNYLPVVEIQRLRDGVGEDTFWCVTYSRNNCLEITHKEKYGHEINMDDQYIAIGSGTIRGRGNTVIAPAEWGRKNGFINEKDRIRRAKTMDEIYVPVTAEELAEGKRSLEFYQFFYEWLPLISGEQHSSVKTLMDALQYAPVQASVDGSAYRFNPQGYIGEFRNYTHEIVIFGYEKDRYWKIFDSETQQPLKFAWDYPFGFPMLHSIEKKTMKMYRKKENLAQGYNGKAIGFVNELGDGLILWSDGQDNVGRTVTGGSIFKTMGFNYSLAEPCDEWPLPIRGYAKVGPQP